MWISIEKRRNWLWRAYCSKSNGNWKRGKKATEDYLGTALEFFKIDLDLLRERDKKYYLMFLKEQLILSQKIQKSKKTLTLKIYLLMKMIYLTQKI